MKSRWEIQFEAWDVAIIHNRRFVARFKPPQDAPATIDGELEILVVLVDKERRDRSPDEADEKGRLLITISGGVQDTEDLACFLATEFKERLCFPAGRMTLLGGFLHAVRIPETAEEEAEVAEERHFVRLTIVEDPMTPRFDIGKFQALSIPHRHGALLRQFNAARSVDTPVERYVGFFKVLEKAYAPRGGNLLDALRRSEPLFQIAIETLRPTPPENGPLSREAFAHVLREMARVRDNCAHLRGRTGYGPGDPRVAGELMPLLGAVEALAKRCVEVHSGPS